VGRLKRRRGRRLSDYTLCAPTQVSLLLPLALMRPNHEDSFSLSVKDD
jgi:hypothetical protein